MPADNIGYSSTAPGKLVPTANMNAILVQSEERFTAFERELRQLNVNTIALDLSDSRWIERDYSMADLLIFFPTFAFSSLSPHAASHVVDLVKAMHRQYPHLSIFPDPLTIYYYNDKYRQYLFLRSRNLPTPKTIPLVSMETVALAKHELGYPMVLKNRHGAGGGAVFKVHNEKELLLYYRLSTLDFWNAGAFRYLLKALCDRSFYYHLIKAKKLRYPLLSFPLLAQEFVHASRDLRVVVCNRKVMEAHWRIQASPSQWKVNIDCGGIGEWSKIPDEVSDLSIRVAGELETNGWLALDFLEGSDSYLVTEFSPVWHHYAYREKPTFVYRDDYNIDVPLPEGLNLEKMVVRSLIDRVRNVDRRDAL
jgi:hypothetical protein